MKEQKREINPLEVLHFILIDNIRSSKEFKLNKQTRDKLVEYLSQLYEFILTDVNATLYFLFYLYTIYIQVLGKVELTAEEFWDLIHEDDEYGTLYQKLPKIDYADTESEIITVISNKIIQKKRNRCGKFDKIVLNIPHSSINGILDKDSGWKMNANLINIMMRETDWHTDFIFNDENNPKVVSCVFPYSRFIVDVERLENDPMEKEGRGIIYTDVHGFKRDYLYAKQTKKLLALRTSHLNGLVENITDNTIVVDCHSFNDDMGSDVDICIGFNEDWSKPSDECINGIVAIFEQAGYKVGINTPYSNSITPSAAPQTFKSIMIEVNKKTYLKNCCEINVDTQYAPKLSKTIKKVYEFLIS